MAPWHRELQQRGALRRAINCQMLKLRKDWNKVSLFIDAHVCFLSEFLVRITSGTSHGLVTGYGQPQFEKVTVSKPHIFSVMHAPAV